MSKAKFWYVYDPNGYGPRYRHLTFESAKIEAERLARLNPGRTFLILECVGECQTVSVQFTEYK